MNEQQQILATILIEYITDTETLIDLVMAENGEPEHSAVEAYHRVALFCAYTGTFDSPRAFLEDYFSTEQERDALDRFYEKCRQELLASPPAVSAPRVERLPELKAMLEQ